MTRDSVTVQEMPTLESRHHLARQNRSGANGENKLAWHAHCSLGGQRFLRYSEAEVDF